jgi:hypothetical protein
MERLSGYLVTWLMVALAAVPLRGGAQDGAQPAPFKKEELEQLVAPIALYPDALVAQILMASTYPLEVVQAARWVKENPNAKDKALEAAMQKQPWDPSVKSLTALPQVLAMMNDKLDWTQRLGDAFLGQPKEVMDTVQRLRAKALAAGNLKSGKEQKVTTEQLGNTTIIKIEAAQPEVVYVPVYNPTVVYGPWPYAAYPPYYYYPPGYVAGTAFLSFTAGVIVGSALWGGCNWGRGDVNINVNKYNSFNKTTINTGDWRHNAAHRKAVPYRDQATARRYDRAVDRSAAQSREQFRGRADAARPDLARTGADGMGGIGDRGAGEPRGGFERTPQRASAFDQVGGRGADVRAQSSRGQVSLASASSGPSGRAAIGGGRAGGGRGK